MKRKRLPVWTVRWHKGQGDWRLYGSIGYEPIFIARDPTKAELVGRMDQLVEKYAPRADGVANPVSVRIRRKNGTVQEERTYPRSADPRRSRG
jgi:hypothetical protein